MGEESKLLLILPLLLFYLYCEVECLLVLELLLSLKVNGYKASKVKLTWTEAKILTSHDTLNRI